MPSRLCPACDRPIPADVAAERVTLRFARSRGMFSIKANVCPDCADPSVAVRQLAGRAGKRETREIWTNMGQLMAAPVKCVTCGHPVILRVDKRRKVNACSNQCRLRYYEAQRPSVPPAVTQCSECGKPAPVGRSDRAYCSNACRQKAYRTRAASPDAKGSLN